MKLIKTFNLSRSVEYSEVLFNGINAVFSFFLILFLDRIAGALDVLMFYLNNGKFNYGHVSANMETVRLSFLCFEIILFVTFAFRDRKNILVRYLVLYPSTKIYSFLVFQVSFVVFLGLYIWLKIDLTQYYPYYISAILAALTYYLLIFRRLNFVS